MGGYVENGGLNQWFPTKPEIVADAASLGPSGNL